jgi:hypothetical protein
MFGWRDYWWRPNGYFGKHFSCKKQKNIIFIYIIGSRYSEVPDYIPDNSYAGNQRRTTTPHNFTNVYFYILCDGTA